MHFYTPRMWNVSCNYCKQVTRSCLPWGTEAACQHCEEPRAAGLETGCYNCCFLWSCCDLFSPQILRFQAVFPCWDLLLKMISWLPRSDTGQIRSSWTRWQLRRTKRPTCLLAAVVCRNSQIGGWKESLEVEWALFAALPCLACFWNYVVFHFPPAHVGIRP